MLKKGEEEIPKCFDNKKVFVTIPSVTVTFSLDATVMSDREAGCCYEYMLE